MAVKFAKGVCARLNSTLGYRSMKKFDPEILKATAFLSPIFAGVIASLSKMWFILHWFLAVWILGLIVFVSYRTYIAIASRHWPSTPSLMSGAAVIESRDSNGSSSTKLDVLYLYEVNGKKHQGRSFRAPFGILAFGASFDAAAKRLNRKTVPVYYSPLNPDLSILEPGIHFLDAIGLLIFYPTSIVVLIFFHSLGVNSWREYFF